MPRVGANELTRAPLPGFLGGDKSIRAALSAPVALPTLAPCTALAARSVMTPSAIVNKAIAVEASSRENMRTGRRPTASDSEPKSSIVPRPDSA